MAEDLNARDAKLIQYLNEAYGKEKQLETALNAHIAMTTRAPYKKRLQEHLRETKSHAREVERRIKQLGGRADGLPGPAQVASAASKVVGAGQRAAAAAAGPLHAVRGTGEAEKMLKNAKTEYQDEYEEIATYTAIETLAEAVGDKETAKLAKQIRREEEKMANFLQRLIPQLSKAVATQEVPAKLRKSSASGRRRSSSRRSTSSRSTSGRSTSSRSKSRATSSRSKSRSGSSAKRSSGSSRRTSSSRSGGSRRSRS